MSNDTPPISLEIHKIPILETAVGGPQTLPDSPEVTQLISGKAKLLTGVFPIPALIQSTAQGGLSFPSMRWVDGTLWQ